VTAAFVPVVEALCVHPVQAVHPGREAVEQALDNEVEMVVEDAVRVE